LNKYGGQKRIKIMSGSSNMRTLDVSAKTEKKGKFTYLSWAWAVDKLIEHHPDATWEVQHFPMMVWETSQVTVAVGAEEGLTPIKNLRAIPEMQVPYMRTDCGYFVEVAVTVDGVTRSQIHPVLNHQNKPIDKPNAFDINTAIQRCLAKAIALHGLGLYIYAGEDLPPEDTGPSPYSTEEVDQNMVRDRAMALRVLIDDDDPETTHDKISEVWNGLSNDERVGVQKLLKEKAPDSNKMYSTLLKEHQNYIPGETA